MGVGYSSYVRVTGLNASAYQYQLLVIPYCFKLMLFVIHLHSKLYELLLIKDWVDSGYTCTVLFPMT